VLIDESLRSANLPAVAEAANVSTTGLLTLGGTRPSIDGNVP
jgi:hypothetical protein